MNNKYLKEIIKNNEIFLKEVESAILKEIPFCSNHTELEERLNNNSDFIVLYHPDSTNKIHVCCSDVDYVEFFDGPSLTHYNNISFTVDLENKKIDLYHIFFTNDDNKITINNHTTKLSRTFTDEDYSGPYSNSIDWVCAGFLHLSSYPAFTSHIEIEDDDQKSKEALDFYTAMKDISQTHSIEIYEYLFNNKKITSETQDIIKLTSDNSIDFDSPEFNKFKFNINEINLEYRPEKQKNNLKIFK